MQRDAYRKSPAVPRTATSEVQGVGAPGVSESVGVLADRRASPQPFFNQKSAGILRTTQSVIQGEVDECESMVALQDQGANSYEPESIQTSRKVNQEQHEDHRIFPFLWGNLTGQEAINAIEAAYDEVVFWRRNVFKIPWVPPEKISYGKRSGC